MAEIVPTYYAEDTSNVDASALKNMVHTWANPYPTDFTQQ